MGITLETGRSGSKLCAQPVMNVTPLVDIALVVLIIFMVVTPLMSKSLWLYVPKQTAVEDADHKPDPGHTPLVLTLDKAGVIRVNKTVVDKAEIVSRLPRMLAAESQRVVYFDAHDEVSYGQAVEVMDLARRGGAQSVAVLADSVLK